MKIKNYVLAFFTFFVAGMNPLFAQWQKTDIDSSIFGGRYFTTCSNGAGGKNLFVGTKEGFYLSTNNGLSWSLQDSGYHNVTALVGINTDLVTVYGYNQIWLSTDNGTTWNYKNELPDEYLYTIAANGTNIFLGSLEYGIWLSTDMFSSLQQSDDGLTNYSILSFAFIGTNVFAATQGGVCLSTNNGNSWAQVDSGLPNPTGSYVPQISVYALVACGSNLFAGVNGDLFLSTNNGASWSELTNISSVNVLAASDGNLFAGTDHGVFLSTNNGANWMTVNAGLTDTSVISLAVMGSNLFVQTSVNNVWMRPLSDMITSIKGHTNQIPNQFELSQNYPNPFNPTTTIQYSLPTRSFMTLKIYNVLGQEVQKLVEGEENTGIHEISFSASSLPSGT
ncbi:MAG TPA: T9SS type A sorting domain-containing protein [Bacteroidota bacterium]|nr:T9SS type A sorting domain-containing protein [Bacteroidota bacterium]